MKALDESRELIDALRRVAAELEYVPSSAVNVADAGTMYVENLKGNPEVRP